MAQVPKGFHGQVTHNDKKQAYGFLENDTIIPTENNMHVIYQDPMNRSFQYDQKQNNFSKLLHRNVH